MQQQAIDRAAILVQNSGAQYINFPTGQSGRAMCQ